MKLENVIQIWLDAEEELRSGNDEKTMELKDDFMEEYKKLNKKDQQYVEDYLESVGA